MTKIEDEIRADGDFTVGLNGVAVINNSFARDFIIAGMFGAKEIEETYKRAFEEWKKDIKYLTALAITCNHLGWKYHNEGFEPYEKLFFGYWEKLDAYILECENAGEDDETYTNFNAEEVRYFIEACD